MSATRIQVFTALLKETWGRLLNAVGMPGAISEGVIEDELTGQKVEIRIMSLYTRISINGRDHYFHRSTGKYGGSGSGCR